MKQSPPLFMTKGISIGTPTLTLMSGETRISSTTVKHLSASYSTMISFDWTNPLSSETAHEM